MNHRSLCDQRCADLFTNDESDFINKPDFFKFIFKHDNYHNFHLVDSYLFLLIEDRIYLDESSYVTHQLDSCLHS